MNRIGKLRKAKNLTQKELAKELNISYRTLQNWETEVRHIKPDMAEVLARYFKVPVSYLLGYEDQFDELTDKFNSENLELFSLFLTTLGFVLSDIQIKGLIDFIATLSNANNTLVMDSNKKEFSRFYESEYNYDYYLKENAFSYFFELLMNENTKHKILKYIFEVKGKKVPTEEEYNYLMTNFKEEFDNK